MTIILRVGQLMAERGLSEAELSQLTGLGGRYRAEVEGRGCGGHPLLHLGRCVPGPWVPSW